MRDEMDLEGGRDEAFGCTRCVHVTDLDGPDPEAVVAGPYCRNDLGVLSMDDCPVLLGGTCFHYEKREGDPEAVDEETLAAVREELLLDFLRWTYWRRVGWMRKDPSTLPEPITFEVKEDPEKEDEEFTYTPPPPKEDDEEEEKKKKAKKPKEKPREELYPGQHRSEERSRRGGPRPAKAAEPAEGEEAEEEEAEPVAKTIDDILAETPAARSAPPRRPKAKSGEGRGRGSRRRRGRGRSGGKTAEGKPGEAKGAESKGDGDGKDKPAKSRGGRGRRRRSGRGRGATKAEGGAKSGGGEGAPKSTGGEGGKKPAGEGQKPKGSGGRRRRRRRGGRGGKPSGGGGSGGGGDAS
ncbi:MAG: hypothetical protein ACYTG4_05755 [Planctomycetota bacterium]|jgi:hypothetical protein